MPRSLAQVLEFFPCQPYNRANTTLCRIKVILTHPTSRVLPGLFGRLKISSDVIPNSLAPGMSGYLGLPPVAMIKFLAEIFFSLPFLSTVLSECGSTKVATGELKKKFCYLLSDILTYIVYLQAFKYLTPLSLSATLYPQFKLPM